MWQSKRKRKPAAIQNVDLKPQFITLGHGSEHLYIVQVNRIFSTQRLTKDVVVFKENLRLPREDIRT